jgi:cell division septum initiation protein DivIVA
MKGRVKGLLAGTSLIAEPPETPEAPLESLSDPGVQRQALQVLTLAQRTADEHLASARRQADIITAEAREQAKQIVQDAENHAQGLRRGADKALADSRIAAEQITRDAQTHAENTRKNADKALNDARSKAGEIAKEAQTNSDSLKEQAQQRYQDIVGSLAAKRETLQQQIEALEQFDHEYRTRLTKFMQSQLRSLWVDQPQVNGEVFDMPAAGPAPDADGAEAEALEPEDAAATAGALPAQRTG